jgi:hypothetical protein
MGVQDREWFHEHRDKVAAGDRSRAATRHQSATFHQHPTRSVFSDLGWPQIGLAVLICLAVLGALFLLVAFRAHWLR